MSTLARIGSELVEVGRDILDTCKRLWGVTETCVKRWAGRPVFGLLVSALTSPLVDEHGERLRHFKFRAEEAAETITLPDENPWKVSEGMVRAVYLRMVSYLDERGTCWVGVEELAEVMAHDPRTIRRAQAALRSLGYLASFKRFEEDERVRGNRRRSNVHVLLLGPKLEVATDSRSNALPRRKAQAATAKAEGSATPFQGPVDNLNRVTGAGADPNRVAEIAAEAKCPVSLALAAVDQARVKAFAGIRGGASHWTRRDRLYETLAAFFLRSASQAPAKPKTVEEIIAELDARERREREELDALRASMATRKRQERHLVRKPGGLPEVNAILDLLPK